MIGDHLTVSESFLRELVDIGLGVEDIENVLLRKMNKEMEASGVTILKIPAREAFDVFFTNLKNVISARVLLRDSSIQTYESVLRRFYDYCTDHSRSEVQVKDIFPEVIPFLLNSQEQRNLAPATLNKYSAILRTFVKEICFQYRLDLPRLPGFYPLNQDLPKALSDTAVQELLHICAGGQYGVRYLCLMLFMLSTGVRRDEFRNIQLRDMDLEQGTVRVIGKGGMMRVVYVPRSLRKFLVFYLDLYSLRNPEHYLYPTTHDPWHPVCPSTIDNTALRLFRKISTYDGPGQMYGYHLHSLRHTFAVSLLRSGVPLRTIAQALGHRSLRSTQIYTALDVVQLREQLDKGLTILSGWWEKIK